MYKRLLIFICSVSFAISMCPLGADAKARLIAVIILRSTAADRAQAVAASKGLARALSQQAGWDARLVDAHGKAPADAAASIGAEVYVVGQYTGANGGSVEGSLFRVATDERLGNVSYHVGKGSSVPNAVSFDMLADTHVSPSPSPSPSPVVATVSIPSGELISVAIQSDIGSRISQEGDTFAVITVEDYYYKGHLVLPKGSAGYGVISHLKRAGSFHAGGELNFTVKRLVTPSHTDVLVETNGATADADKTTEHNGNAFGQYLLWGVGMFAKRGNDILVKNGTTFHVSTLQNDGVPVAADGAQPSAIDPTLVTKH